MVITLSGMVIMPSGVVATVSGMVIMLSGVVATVSGMVITPVRYSHYAC